LGVHLSSIRKRNRKNYVGSEKPLPTLIKEKLRQQRGLKMVLAYVTNVLVKMNMFRTRCMLFYFAKTIEFVS